MPSDKEPVMVRLDPDDKQWLREHAARQGVSMGAILVRLCKAERQIAEGLAVEDDRQNALVNQFASGEHQAI